MNEYELDGRKLVPRESASERVQTFVRSATYRNEAS